MARLRSGPAAPASPPKARNTRQALREKTNITRTKAPVYEDDGDTNDLIKDIKTKATRGRSKKAIYVEDDHVMTGALAHADTDLTAPLSDAPLPADEVAKDDVLAAPKANTKANRRPPRMMRRPVQKEAQSKVLDVAKNRMEATARDEAAKRKDAPVSEENPAPLSDALSSSPATGHQPASVVHQRAGLSTSPSPSSSSKFNAVPNKRSSTAQPGSAMRPQNTPAVESSILALKNFKRRPRQPSMLQMVQQRTQSTRPSAVNAMAQEDSNASDLVGDEEDLGEDDFAPDAEGTPVHVTTANGQSSTSTGKVQPDGVYNSPSAQTTTVPRKRTSDHASTPLTALEALQTKRRRTGAARVVHPERLSTTRLSPIVRQPIVQQEATPEPPDMSEVQVLHSSPLSSPASPNMDFAVPSTEEGRDLASTTRQQPNVDDRASTPPTGTMADPISSSPPPPDSLTRHHPDEIADPVTQISPPRPERRFPRKDKTKPVSTATLQALLPKRRPPPKGRQVKRTEYDFASSSEADDDPLDVSHLMPDEDELGGRLRRRAKPTPSKASNRSTVTAVTKQNKQSKNSTRTSQPSRRCKATTTQARKSTAPPSTSRQHKTYSRRANKENHGSPSRFEDVQDEEGDDDLPGEPLPEASVIESAELKAAKRKFAAVDQWDMEFESMSAEDHRSSSLQWR